MISQITSKYRHNHFISFKSNDHSPSKRWKENFAYSDSFVYRNGDAYTDPELKTLLSDIKYAYEIIDEMLDKKTGTGKKRLITESQMFNLKGGLTLKNLDETGIQYTISKPENTNLASCIRITEKNANNDILNDWLFSSYRLVKENNSSKIDFYNKKETETIKTTNDLPNKFKKIDENLFKLRMFITKRKDQDLIPPAGILNTDTQNLISEITTNTKTIENKFNTISQSSVKRLKNRYPNYCLTGQNTYTFKNLDDNNIKINFNKYNSTNYGELTRILVYNKTDEAIDGFLLKDNKIVSNFMLNNPFVLPKKLLYVAKDQIGTEEYEKKLNHYLTLYNNELVSFLKYLNNWQNYDGTMPDKQKEEFIQANQSYKNIIKTFENLNNIQIAQYKKDYPKLKTGANIKGFFFENIDEKLNSINYVKVKNKHHDNLYRLNVINQNNDIVKVFLIKDNEKMVSNINMTYPELVPKFLKFYKEEDFENMTDLKFIEYLKNNMKELEDYITNRYTTEEITKKETTLNKKKNTELIKQKHNKQQISEEYKTMVKQAKQVFRKSIEFADINPKKFFETLETIKKDFENYFERLENNQ